MTDLQAPFNPNWSSPPGDTIFDILQERGISQAELGHALHLGLRQIRDLIDGNLRITLGMANLLSSFLGSSPEFWMMRDYQYCEKEGLLDKYRGKPPQPQQKSFWWQEEKDGD